jgi:acid stress-induced BolA-like protein IbaG/YrbA
VTGETMHFFVTFVYEVLDETKDLNFEFIHNELEELGLSNLVKVCEEDVNNLPKFMYVGEYKFTDKNELKNVLYTEIRKLFESNGVHATIFISVSEDSTFGVISF